MKKHMLALLCAALLTGCTATAPKNSLQLAPESLENRQMQTRRFETTNKATMLSAAASVLQDMGFNLEETETGLGVLTASKQRDAKHGGEIVTSFVIGLVTGVNPSFDTSQTIRVSVVMRENSTRDSIVRATFQRFVFNSRNLVSKAEQINDPQVYQAFYEKLSKSLFLEAHQI